MKSMLCALFALVAVANAQHYEPMIPYSYGYSTSDGMSRTESGHGGVVSGSYSYTDANGDLRTVKYVADQNGYRPEGDISVDRKTAAAAAALAALAPKAPLPQGAPAWGPAPAAPVAASFRSFNSWDNSPRPYAAAPAPVAWSSAPVGATPVGVLSYQVETPTHKIWVKY